MFEDSYVEYRLMNLKPQILQVGEQYVIRHVNFPYLNIVAKSPADAKTELLDIICQELEKSQNKIVVIDYICEQLSYNALAKRGA
jgi:hypothetical protein